LALLLIGCSPAQPAERLRGNAEAPAAELSVCASSHALFRIRHSFAWADRTLWHRGVAIAELGNPRLSGHTDFEPGMIFRAYCVADVILSDGSQNLAFYTIEYGLGFAGLGRDIQFCLPGSDPWHVHDGQCRTAR